MPNSKIVNCSSTGKPVCRRMFNINLALGYSEEFFCLEKLSEMHNKSMEEMFDFAFDYVQARECFSKEWAKMKDKGECPLPYQCVIDKCFNE